ncbi:MAG TPA: hypothetical protein VNT50_11605 [Microbacterium sp.]|uniref:hypothetical protein n=1 Tax=Microbacterium sp. TaxID=51671 RepID=UPI002B7760B1|nr:hypothetical protein [Microbacterium sp.]HWI32129.1 hypothetical protein [Microbacterium sp.]
MLILLALIAGAVAGMAIHFAMPHRSDRGVVLAPAIGAATAGVLYTSLQWAGFAEDNPWLWAVSIVVPVAVAYLATLLLTRARGKRDAAERTRLGIA